MKAINLNELLPELNKMQAWIPGYEGKYYADINGSIWRVRKTVPDTEMTGYIKKDKYIVKLTQSGKSVDVSKHQLIWISFNGKIPDGWIVVRKNGIIKDVYLQNLALRTKIEHGRLTGPRSRSKEVVQLDNDEKEVNSWRSARRAARDLYCSYQTVMDICNNKRKKPIFKLIWADKVGRRRA